MLFRPIRTEAELRAAVTLHQTTEGLYLDFKCAIQKQGDKGKEDTALDVAAFANTWGGTLLVGIKEKEINGVRVADEVMGCDYESDRKWVEQVIRDRVVPPDVGLECKELEWGGKVVMAVNVAPDDRLIAAWDRVRATYFPIRNNQGNEYMSPSEIVARASISARAGEIKLRRAADLAGYGTLDGDGKPKPINVHLGSGMAEVCTVQRGTGGSVQGIRRLWRAVSLLALESDHVVLGIDVPVERPAQPMHDRLYVPYGVVREAWSMGRQRIGLILGMRAVRTDPHNWALEQYGE